MSRNEDEEGIENMNTVDEPVEKYSGEHGGRIWKIYEGIADRNS